MKNQLSRSILFAAALLTSATSFAFEEGDTLSPELRERLNIQDDKITIVDFFASWCVSCRVELPQISQLMPNLDASQVEVLGINVDEELEEGQAYIDTFKDQGGLNFRVVMDPEQQMIETFEPLGMPALYFIKNGKVSKMHLGAMPNIDQVIVSDLKELGYR